MQPEEVQKKIAEALTDCQVQVTEDGGHYNIVVVGERFAGMSPVNKQREVYAIINDEITSGALHAVNIKTLTPEERDRAAKLNIS